jgi:hypothetical protein
VPETKARDDVIVGFEFKPCEYTAYILTPQLPSSSPRASTATASTAFEFVQPRENQRRISTPTNIFAPKSVDWARADG